MVGPGYLKKARLLSGNGIGDWDLVFLDFAEATSRSRFKYILDP